MTEKIEIIGLRIITKIRRHHIICSNNRPISLISQSETQKVIFVNIVDRQRCIRSLYTGNFRSLH